MHTRSITVRLVLACAVAGTVLTGAVMTTTADALAPREHRDQHEVTLATPSRIDLGAALPESLIEGSFLIANVGGQTIRIDDVKPACGCTEITDAGTASLKPGGVTRIAFVMKVPKELGEHSKKLTVVPAGQEPIQVTLKVLTQTPQQAHADAARRPMDPQPSSWTVLPSAFDFGTVAAGAVMREKLYLANGSDDPIVITDITGNCGCTTLPDLQLPLTIRPWQVVAVDVEMKVSKKPGVKATKMIKVVDARAYVRQTSLTVATRTAEDVRH